MLEFISLSLLMVARSSAKLKLPMLGPSTISFPKCNGKENAHKYGEKKILVE